MRNVCKQLNVGQDINREILFGEVNKTVYVGSIMLIMCHFRC